MSYRGAIPEGASPKFGVSFPNFLLQRGHRKYSLPNTISMLLAIDPGNTSGWALFGIDTYLVACGLNLDADESSKIFRKASRVIIERPKIYPGGRTKNPNDVLKVAVMAGEWGGLARANCLEPVYVEPAEWKRGQVPKEIQHARDQGKLTPAEKAVIAKVAKGMAASRAHNMLDAIGIGLFGLKR